MRDGEGNRLSEEEAAKVKAAEVKPGEASLNKVSVDPKAGVKPADDTSVAPAPAPSTTTGPKF